QRVYLVGLERAWRGERHRAIQVVVQRRRVGPVIADGLHEARVAAEREALPGLATRQPVKRPLRARLAVTRRALAAINLGALRGRAASGRQPGSVGHDVGVPCPDLRRRRWPPDA